MLLPVPAPTRFHPVIPPYAHNTKPQPCLQQPSFELRLAVIYLPPPPAPHVVERPVEFQRNLSVPLLENKVDVVQLLLTQYCGSGQN